MVVNISDSQEDAIFFLGRLEYTILFPGADGYCRTLVKISPFDLICACITPIFVRKNGKSKEMRVFVTVEVNDLAALYVYDPLQTTVRLEFCRVTVARGDVP